MAEFNSYLLGKARKSVGNLTIVYAKGKNIVRAKVFGRKDNPTPEVLMQRMRVRLLGRFALSCRSSVKALQEWVRERLTTLLWRPI